MILALDCVVPERLRRRRVPVATPARRFVTMRAVYGE
jgi:hypothetical protein